MNSQISSPPSISFLSGFTLRGILRAGSFNKAPGLFTVHLFVDFTTRSLTARSIESAINSSSGVYELSISVFKSGYTSILLGRGFMQRQKCPQYLQLILHSAEETW